MMWRLIFQVIALTALMKPAVAQEMVVKTGEHEGFARLVTQIPRNAEWSVEKRGRIVEFVVKNLETGFDISEVFIPISRDRIGKISSLQDRLILTLSCSCNVSAFQVDASYIALDVANSDFSLGTPLVLDLATTEPTKVKPVMSNEPSKTSILPLFPERGLRFELKVPNLTDDTVPESSVMLNLSNSNLLVDMRQQLAREVGGAATKGILIPSARPLSKQIIRSDQEQKPIKRPKAVPQLPLESPTQNMRITTGMDTIASRKSEYLDRRQSKHYCSLGEKLKISEWNDGLDFDAQISIGRSILFGEFDHLNAENLINLSKSYLYFGFGQEARQILLLSSEAAAKNSYLLEIALIIDQVVTIDQSGLSSLSGCDNDAALWALLAGPEISKSSELNTSAALRTLNSLPTHLREILAPELAKRLQSYGDFEAAYAALRSIDRLPSVPRPLQKMAQAQQHLAKGELADGVKKLETIISKNVVESPEALITLVNSQVETNSAISENHIQLLEAYAKEFWSTDLGLKLSHAHLRGLIATEQFEQAQSQILLLKRQNGAKITENLDLELFSAIVEKADNVLFLKYTFENMPSSASESTMLRLADRYIALGFPSEAEQVLNQMDDSLISEKKSLLMAQASLALSQPYQAQAYLLEVTGPEAARLNAQALLQIGQHAPAAALLRNENAAVEAESAAWLAEDWQKISNPDSPVFGPILNVATSSTKIDEAVGPLAASKGAIEESSIARQTIEALLAEASLQVPIEAQP